MILGSWSYLFPETAPWQGLLDVLSWMSGLRPVTEATPVPVTGWARGWEPACLTWSSLSMISSSLTEQLLCERWVLMSVSAGAATWKWLQSHFFDLICCFLGLKCPQKPLKVFRLPDFPPPLAYHYVQNYYSDMVASLGKAINTTPPEESALLARYYTAKEQGINCL